MKNTRFMDYEGWGRYKRIESTEEFVKILTQVVWYMRPKLIRVKFCDTTKKDLVLMTDYTKKFFEDLGEVSPEEVQLITLFSYNFNIEFESWREGWRVNENLFTSIKEIFDENKTQISARYGKTDTDKFEKILISTNYGKDDTNNLMKNLISTNYGRKNQISEEDN